MVPTEVADVDEAVLTVGLFNDAAAAVTAAGCFEFEPAFAGVGSSVSGAGVAGGVLTLDGSAASVDGAASVVPVCAPPLLLTVTPAPTSVLDDVVPEVVAVDVVPVDVDPLVDVEPLPAVVEVEVPVVVAADPVDSPVAVEVVDDVSEEVPVVSAPANP